jgi:alpha-L-rhamnosidase
MYKMYGDTELLREHYGSMEEYMAAIERERGADGALAVYGDWLAYDPTDKEYISLCYHAQNARMMAEISRVLGKGDRAAHYERLLARIKELFGERYVADGDLTERSQTAYLLALGFDVADKSLHPKLAEKLKEKIIENDYTLSTGFVGTGVITMVLSQLGLDGLAYSLLLQTKDPSWLFSVREGATTIWERWNSHTKNSGFGNVKMNSFNHYAYGAIAEWMFAYMAGIQPGEAGFEHFLLCPRPDMRSEDELPKGQKRISRVSAEYTCRYGTIRSAWEINEGEVTYRFEVPRGTSAHVEIFAPNGRDHVEINGEKRGADTVLETKEGKKWGFELPKGKYIIK